MRCVSGPFVERIRLYVTLLILHANYARLLAWLVGWLVGWCDKWVGWRDIKTPNWHKCQPQFLSARGRGFLVKWSSSTVRTLRDLVVFVRGKSIRRRQRCGVRALSGGKHEEVFYFDTTIREILFSPALAGRSESKISYLEVRLPSFLEGFGVLLKGTTTGMIRGAW